MIREPVAPQNRVKLTPKRRLEVLIAFGGRCNTCKEKITGPFDIDHVLALINGGSNEVGNLVPLHPECHRLKTKGDVKIAAKIKRLNAREDGTRRERKPIQSRGFDTTKSRRFDGSVVPRTVKESR